MSLKYRDVTGKETPIAGLNGLSGELVPSVSYYQSGTAGVTTEGSGEEEISVTFPEPMNCTDYVLTFEFLTNVDYLKNIKVLTKTATGFDAVVYSTTEDEYISFRYHAFKLMTDASRALDEQAIAQNASDIATLKSSVSAIGKYGYSGVKTANITGGSTSAVQLATTVKLSAGKTYLLGLHVEQPITDGACTVEITNASGTPLAFWETSFVCPIGKCKLGWSFPVKLAADTTLGIKVTPWQASAGNWTMGVEISWTRLS